MRKLTIALLTAVMSLCLAGCGMTAAEYEENPNVQYLITGDFVNDLAALTASIPLEEEGELDYDAWNSLENHCESIVNLEGCPKELEDAHQLLVKASNNLLSQIDLITDCAARASTYRITGDAELQEEIGTNLEGLEALLYQAVDYIEDAKEIIEAA